MILKICCEKFCLNIIGLKDIFSLHILINPYLKCFLEMFKENVWVILS